MTTFMSKEKGVTTHHQDMKPHVVPTSEVAGASGRRT